MNILDDVQSKVKSYFNKWIQVVDFENEVTIEFFPYSEGAKDLKEHCAQCVTINKCWFVDEKDKKPEEFDYGKFLFIPLPKFGLYHPFCHCHKLNQDQPSKNQITLLMLNGKIDYFFKDKLGWYYSWGYKDDEKEEFVKIVEDLVKEAYANGDYEKVEENQYGFKINLFINLPGRNEKANRIYKLKSCFMIFPDLKLKLNTLIGGWAE